MRKAFCEASSHCAWIGSVPPNYSQTIAPDERPSRQRCVIRPHWDIMGGNATFHSQSALRPTCHLKVAGSNGIYQQLFQHSSLPCWMPSLLLPLSVAQIVLVALAANAWCADLLEEADGP
jgi:hypothetical protein